MSDKGEEKADSSSGKNVEAKKDIVTGPPSPKRVKLGDKNDFKKMTRDHLLSKFQDQDHYIDRLEEKLGQCSNSGELTSLRESEEKLKLQQQESTRRENVLVMRLATKEQEMQELLTQIHDLKQAQNPAGAQLRSTLLDPAVNIVFQRMKTELDETKEKLEQAQNDLSAWKFTPDSVTGKKLMAKCRMLIQENQELGRQLSQGRVAQLEAELALQKKYSEELKTSQDELNEFVIQLDEEVEGMQSTILALQQQLKGVKHALVEEKENGEKQVEQIRVLEHNLDQARTQPPSPVVVESVEKQPVSSPTPQAMECEPERPETNESENMETRTESSDDINHTNPSIPSAPEEPSVKILPAPPAASTPPGSTTFSISQILGEPKKVSPVPDSAVEAATGGDAVVTKLPYTGGLKDPNGEVLGLMTDGPAVVNGQSEDVVQPMVT